MVGVRRNSCETERGTEKCEISEAISETSLVLGSQVASRHGIRAPRGRVSGSGLEMRRHRRMLDVGMVPNGSAEFRGLDRDHVCHFFASLTRDVWGLCSCCQAPKELKAECARSKPGIEGRRCVGMSIEGFGMTMKAVIVHGRRADGP